MRAADPGRRLSLRAWGALLALAVTARLAFYSGYFGSDEVTYVASAWQLLSGDWTVSSYVGANRYGVNLPLAGLAWLFGRSEASAAAYSLLCSVAEVALVAGIGARLVGARAAWVAGLVLASLPTHVHLAGRLLADSPLSLMVSATFLFFWLGERSRRPLHYLLAGAAAGFSFWIKPAAIFYAAVLLAYPIVVRRFDLRWTWVVVGFAAMLLANCVLFWALTGRFWFIFQAMSERKGSGYLEQELASGALQNEAWYYLVYLFGKVYHTWLLGLAAVGGACFILARRANHGTQAPGPGYVLFWAIGLVLVLSLLPVSFSPLVFVPKQTNYMLMFVAPLALLAGVFVAPWRGPAFASALGILIVPGLLLAALLQASVTVFTANAKAAVDWARANPGVTLFTTTNPFRAAQFENLVRRQAPAADVRFVGELAKSAESGSNGHAKATRWVLIDEETLAWGSGEPYRDPRQLPACWVSRGVVEPRIEGLGPRLLQGTAVAARAIGLTLVADRAHGLATPAPARLFELPPGC